MGEVGGPWTHEFAPEKTTSRHGHWAVAVTVTHTRILRVWARTLLFP